MNHGLAPLLALTLFMAPGFDLGTGSAACRAWELDGYRIGMSRDEILDVRSVTIHKEGQAEVVQRGHFSGVLVLDPTIGLEKWQVHYEHREAEELRAELTSRLGKPVSDETKTMFEDPTNAMRQRRTIWRSDACNAAIAVDETINTGDTASRSVVVTLAVSSRLKR